MARAMAAWLLLGMQSAAGNVSPAGTMPEYLPGQLPDSFEASYRRTDGTIAIVGYNDMAPMLERLNAMFMKAHPGTRFEMQLHGTATAAPALAYGRTAFAPMGAEFSNMELAAYRARTGRDPLQIRVAHCALNPAALSAPIAIVVNSQNPIARLTLDQLQQLFAAGSPGGDFSRWGQLGLHGDWWSRPVHPVGIAEERSAGLADFMLTQVLGGLPFARDYTGLFHSRAVVQRVAEDLSAIGFASATTVSSQVKTVAIAKTAGDEFLTPTVDSVVSDSYPLNRHLYFYAKQSETGSLDRFVVEYLRLVLSRQGQAAIADSPPGYLPLSVDEVVAQRVLLQRMK